MSTTLSQSPDLQAWLSLFRWITMRAGPSRHRTVYWYTAGEVLSQADGKVLARLEGLDATRPLVIGPTEVHQLSRKVVCFRDSETNALISDYKGKPVEAVKYPYQHITHLLRGGKLITEVTSGSGSELKVLRGQTVQVRHSAGDDLLIFTCPVHLMVPSVAGVSPVYERYDYFTSKGNQVAPHFSMVRVGPAAPFGDDIIMNAVGYKVEKFDLLPESIQDVVGSMGQMWKEAPKDFVEVRRLQT